MFFPSSPRVLSLLLVLAAVWHPAAVSAASECSDWQTRKPEWIFCDDFEQGGALVAAGRYFEYDDNQGDFKPVAGAGFQGSTGMRAIWQSAEMDAGSLKLGFGRAPGTYFSKGIRTSLDFREIYYRVFMRLQKGWQGNPYKLSRATVIAKSDWSQAMVAHLWGDATTHLQLDPVRCTDSTGAAICVGYNDFAHMQWIGAKAGTTPLYDGNFGDKWMCVEAHVRLNDAGRSNGVQEFWLDDTLQARREGLDFLDGYHEYGINGVFLENYWNSGSPRLQERYLDNFVVSTQRIGCDAAGTTSLRPPRPKRKSDGKPRFGFGESVGAFSVDVFGDSRNAKGAKIGSDYVFGAPPAYP